MLYLHSHNRSNQMRPFELKHLPAFAALTIVSPIFFASSLAHSASLTVHLSDAAGNPLADTVVFAELATGQAQSKSNVVTEIEQKGRKFSPLVTVVQTGSEISFPNHDTVRHHVYSFSPAKTFDIKLYSGVPGSPVRFDKPGSVVVGCNIHDQMLAYIHVVSTPYFAKTDAKGDAQIHNVVAGNYKLKAWHYKAPAPGIVSEKSVTVTSTDVDTVFKLDPKTTATINQ